MRYSVTVLVVAAVATRAWAAPIKAAIFRSTGTYYLNQTIWWDLNTGWPAYGDIPVEIDYRSLAGPRITLSEIEATGSDVVVLSNPAFWTYEADEIDALIDYVEAGHGLVISYGKFRSEDRGLAPLVGLSETVSLGTSTYVHPIQVEPMSLDHPVFFGVNEPYVTGVPYMARPPYPQDWPLDGGSVIADAFTANSRRLGAIITKETEAYRGLYFAYYIEDRADGANAQDIQVFYNGLLWAAGIPEPTTALLLLAGVPFLRGLRRPARARQ